MRLDRTESETNRSSSSFVSAVPIQKTRRGFSWATIFSDSPSQNWSEISKLVRDEKFGNQSNI